MADILSVSGFRSQKSASLYMYLQKLNNVQLLEVGLKHIQLLNTKFYVEPDL